MPSFGVELPGIGAVLPGNNATLERHRSMERAKMSKARQPGIMRASRELQVYIYNVGPFSRKMELGSPGVVILPALDEKKVLQELSVAGPLIRQGFPAEPYPGEPRNQWIEHEPGVHLNWRDEDGEMFVLNERPGIDEALRIIGGHEQSPNPVYCASPYQMGCFVSVIPEQSEPKGPKEPGDKSPRSAVREYEKAMVQYEEDVRFWLKWEVSVKAAQSRFTDFAMRRGEEQCFAYSNGTYIRDEELYVLSRIFHKTEKDWNFLAGTSANVKTKSCWSCGRAVQADIPKCQCGELQISQAEYDARRKQVLGGEVG